MEHRLAGPATMGGLPRPILFSEGPAELASQKATSPRRICTLVRDAGVVSESCYLFKPSAILSRCRRVARISIPSHACASASGPEPRDPACRFSPFRRQLDDWHNDAHLIIIENHFFPAICRLATFADHFFCTSQRGLASEVTRWTGQETRALSRLRTRLRAKAAANTAQSSGRGDRATLAEPEQQACSVTRRFTRKQLHYFQLPRSARSSARRAPGKGPTTRAHNDCRRLAMADLTDRLRLEHLSVIPLV